jgi:hypothetical protein
LGALTIKDVIELITEYRENPKQSVINVSYWTNIDYFKERI